MAFDLKRLAEDSVDLETPLRASLDSATGGLTLAAVGDRGPHYELGPAIPINPPSLTATVVHRADHIDYAAELAAAIAQCQSAAARAGELLARLRGAS